MKRWKLFSAHAVILMLILQSGGVVLGQDKQFDILIRHAYVFDGLGGDSVLVDVGITGDRIAYVGNLDDGSFQADRIIDASGLYLSPGFIDPHTHYFSQLSHEDRQARAVHRALAQGVTTVFEGNDGGGPLEVGQVLNAWGSNGIGPNAALFAGHNTIRRKVLGSDNVQPNEVQLQEMKDWVARAMEQGAFGLSTGLFYNPGNFSKTEEVIDLAKVAARYGGIYDTHQRDEGSQSIGVFNSSREVLEIAEKAGIPVHISHIKVAGPESWGRSSELIAMIEEAQERGLNVTANQYPYIASRTGLHSALMPSWVLDGGLVAMRSRLRQPELRDAIIQGIQGSIQARTADPAKLVLASQDDSLNGKSLADLAKEWGVTAEEAVIKVCLESAPSVHSFMMQEEDIENFMVRPWVMTGSDGGSGHPRAFGTFARLFREYVFNRQVMSVAEAIYKSSYLTAQTLQVKDRGLIKPGYYADIVLFDPQQFRAESDYLDGEQLATGVMYVLVNGQLAIDQGILQEGLYGKALRLQ